MSAPRFSVIIAAYNAERTVAAAVRAALAQTVGDLEVIVVDDGSQDRTAAVVQQLGDPRVQLLSQVNKGPAVARNLAIGESHGTYLSFLDSDDLWLPRYLELAGAALDRTERAGFAYTDAYVFDPVSGRVRRETAMQPFKPPIPPPADSEGFLLELLRRNFVYGSATVPRHVLDEVGGWNTSRVQAEDYELWLRILAAGYAGRMDPRSTCALPATSRSAARRRDHDVSRSAVDLHPARRVDADRRPP